MKIGLIDVDGHNYPNLPLMKLSAWHKKQGDAVEWYDTWNGLFNPYDKVYLSKVFSFTEDYKQPIYTKEVIRGGTGYCITNENGKEIFHKEQNYNPTEEIRRRIGEVSRKVNTGRKHTEEYKQRMSKRMKANNPNANGKALTPERITNFTEYAKKPKTESQKKKMSESAKKHKVYCVETGEIFESMKDASEKLGIEYSTVSAAVYRGTKVKGIHIKTV